MEVLRIDSLPNAALQAAAAFHAQWAAQATALLQRDHLIIRIPAADYDHDDWRRAAIRDLARTHTPHRAVMVAGGDDAAFERTRDYLAAAPGVTGQLIELSE